MGLTAKNARFCEEYIIDLNATQAAIRSGYSEDSAGSIGGELLQKPEVRARIEMLKGIAADRAMVSAEYVLKGLQEVAERCMQKSPVLKWDYVEKAMVPVLDEDGNAVYQFDSNGANKALELLGKHVGVFEADNKQKQAVITVNIQDDEDDSN